MAERPIDLELVAELRELGQYLETPAPDLTAVVRARLTRNPPRHTRRRPDQQNDNHNNGDDSARYF